jgi:hypothetical protein
LERVDGLEPPLKFRQVIVNAPLDGARFAKPVPAGSAER